MEVEETRRGGGGEEVGLESGALEKGGIVCWSWSMDHLTQHGARHATTHATTHAAAQDSDTLRVQRAFGVCSRPLLSDVHRNFVVRAVAIEVEERGLDEPSEERPECAPRHSYSEPRGDLKGAAEVEEEQEDGGGGDGLFVLTQERLALFPRGRFLLLPRLDGEFEVVVPGAKHGETCACGGKGKERKGTERNGKKRNGKKYRSANDQCQVGCHVFV